MTRITVGCGKETRLGAIGLGGLGAIDHEKKPGFYEKKKLVGHEAVGRIWFDLSGKFSACHPAHPTIAGGRVC